MYTALNLHGCHHQAAFSLLCQMDQKKRVSSIFIAYVIFKLLITYVTATAAVSVLYLVSVLHMTVLS